MLYFAYGSNMSHKEMLRHCSNSKFLESVRLKNYKFVYDGYSRNRNCSVANVVEEIDNEVWGGLYEITKNDLNSLNKKEGYPNTYQSKILEVSGNTSNFNALVFYRTGECEGDPSEEYRNLVIEGADDCSLPDWLCHFYFYRLSCGIN